MLLFICDRCVGSCNSLNDLSNRLCVPNKTKDLNRSVFHMIAGINESKTLIKYTSCECKCKTQNEVQSKSGITVNVSASMKINEKRYVCKKDYIWNPASCSWEKGK